MKKKAIVLTALILIVLCVACTLAFSRVAVLKYEAEPGTAPDDYTVTLDLEDETITLQSKKIQNGKLILEFRSHGRGSAFVTVAGPGTETGTFLYSHLFGVISQGGFFGRTRAGFVFPLAAAVFLLMLLADRIRCFKSSMRQSLYRYRNVTDLAWIILLTEFVLEQIPLIFSHQSIITVISRALYSLSQIATFTFPFALLLFILVTVSNIVLMKKEGRTWRNMLGAILGILICLGILIPLVLGEILQRATFVDVHNEQGAALYVEMIVTNLVLTVVAYFERILLATVILSVAAARRTPAFDREYILILGCQVRRDGTLTNLLRARADSALAFARKQKEKTGRDLIFVPSGGKGADEPVAEAEAIRNYLLQQGIPEERILVEDQSKNTLENIQNSAALIRSREKTDDVKIAFATTNYHVFRAGVLAENEGVHMQGVSGKTRSYFWINAFVREFAATLYSQRRRHVKMLLFLILAMLLMIGAVWFSNHVTVL